MSDKQPGASLRRRLARGAALHAAALAHVNIQPINVAQPPPQQQQQRARHRGNIRNIVREPSHLTPNTQPIRGVQGGPAPIIARIDLTMSSPEAENVQRPPELTPPPQQPELTQQPPSQPSIDQQPLTQASQVEQVEQPLTQTVPVEQAVTQTVPVEASMPTFDELLQKVNNGTATAAEIEILRNMRTPSEEKSPELDLMMELTPPPPNEEGTPQYPTPTLPVRPPPAEEYQAPSPSGFTQLPSSPAANSPEQVNPVQLIQVLYQQLVELQDKKNSSGLNESEQMQLANVRSEIQHVEAILKDMPSEQPPMEVDTSPPTAKRKAQEDLVEPPPKRAATEPRSPQLNLDLISTPDRKTTQRGDETLFVTSSSNGALGRRLKRDNAANRFSKPLYTLNQIVKMRARVFRNADISTYVWKIAALKQQRFRARSPQESARITKEIQGIQNKINDIKKQAREDRNINVSEIDPYQFLEETKQRVEIAQKDIADNKKLIEEQDRALDAKARLLILPLLKNYAQQNNTTYAPEEDRKILENQLDSLHFSNKPKLNEYDIRLPSYGDVESFARRQIAILREEASSGVHAKELAGHQELYDRLVRSNPKYKSLVAESKKFDKLVAETNKAIDELAGFKAALDNVNMSDVYKKTYVNPDFEIVDDGAQPSDLRVREAIRQNLQARAQRTQRRLANISPTETIRQQPATEEERKQFVDSTHPGTQAGSILGMINELVMPNVPEERQNKRFSRGNKRKQT